MYPKIEQGDLEEARKILNEHGCEGNFKNKETLLGIHTTIIEYAFSLNLIFERLKRNETLNDSELESAGIIDETLEHLKRTGKIN